jgi:hypothetical protein
LEKNLKKKIMKKKLVIAFVAFNILSLCSKGQSSSGTNALSGTVPNPTQYLGSSNTYDIVFKTNAVNERMRVLNSNGNIGIGITNPLNKLSVQTSGTNDGIKIINTSSYAAGLHLSNTNTSGHTWALFSTGTGNISEGAGNFTIYDYGTGFTRFFISGSTGNIGIGTITPDPAYLLSVNGKIRAKEIKVETGWSDFVFEKHYKLKTLFEVENYINENGHLPEIPTAKEVEENGIEVGQIESKLLQKIEELTLYVIEQNKKIETLQKEVDSLKK